MTRIDDVIGRGAGRRRGPAGFSGLGLMGEAPAGSFADAFQNRGSVSGMYGRMSDGGLTDVPADERRAAARENFFQSPDYTFRLDEGLKALDRSAAARGQMLSGGHLKDLTRFSQGMASTEYQNYVNRLASMAGFGQAATGRATGLGQATAGNISGLQADTGAARASGYLTAAQGVQSGVQNTMDFISSNPGAFGLPTPGG